MSSPPLPSNVGSVDLESVLNVGRRTLSSIGEKSLPRQQYRYTDTIYVKREDSSNSVLSINSKILIFGELQLLCSIFERYTSNITVYEETIESNSNKTSFSTTFEEDEDNTDEPAIVSTLRTTSISSQSSSPPKTPGSPPRRKQLSSIGRSATIGSTTSDYALPNLEGKRYGCIQVDNMSIIEILEILLRAGLELVNETSDYDKENVLHQNFVFSKIRPISQKLPQSYFSRSSSFVGT
jgi:hypothetical protein